MKNSQSNTYEKIIRHSVISIVEDLPYVSKLSKETQGIASLASDKNKAVVIDFLENSKIAITVYVVLFHTEQMTIPQISCDIQHKIIERISAVVNYKIKSVDVVITGVLI